MVSDALRHMEEKGTSPEESWMEVLKKAAGSAFLGMTVGCLARSFAHVCYATSQPHQKLYVTERLQGHHNH